MASDCKADSLLFTTGITVAVLMSSKRHHASGAIYRTTRSSWRSIGRSNKVIGTNEKSPHCILEIVTETQTLMVANRV